ncbi:hypothetical protein ND856_14670 [Leptospira bandrabouensis]|uniref:GH36-type glycosyl hydrolase domain-containing protein n=1 Tax=Leptospira bandrabouensis TaxID=2484903 RepID=UPI00223DBA3E|nr:amylo-alpha-1,6-glucosidase [Leptospira bandrabouensis]MCW7458611.1 hypothetical protein [Leptospira bandrabouensis]MCW7478537.1 hypothetical protein [Leptospira bandrabouensis]MCW7486178.1 hypothetical protein [Leptospira bandrabouensis]
MDSFFSKLNKLTHMMQNIQNSSGLKFKFLYNGNVHSIRFNELLVNLYLGNEMEQAVSNLYLRIHSENSLIVFPLLGPKSNSEFQISEFIFIAQGNFQKIDYQVHLELHPNQPTWRYKVDLTNKNNHPVSCDLVYVQDIGICDYAASRLNEYFVCHYIHHEPILSNDYGYGVLSRQNELMSGKNPACFLFSSEPIRNFATDGLDLYPNGILNQLTNKRRQGEHSIIGLEREPFTLEPDEQQNTCFYGSLFSHLETISSFQNKEIFIKKMITGWNDNLKTVSSFQKPIPSLFTNAKQIQGDSLNEMELKSFFPDPWREVEKRESSSILSFFTDESTHVVLKEKESLCLRPHGQILRTGLPMVPDESSLTVTCYMKGIFLSQLTEGHSSINQYISRNHSYLGLSQSYGFRIFLEDHSDFFLLDSPSVFAMKPNHLEWIYKWNAEEIRVQVETTFDHKIKFKLKTNTKTSKKFLFSFHIALDGDNGALELPPKVIQNKNELRIEPNPKSNLYQRLDGKGFKIISEELNTWEIADDRFLYLDGKSKGQSYLTAKVSINDSFQFTIQGNLNESQQESLAIKNQKLTFFPSFKEEKLDNKSMQSIKQIQEILPWFEQNALIHYLNPRGLEQYSGGGWGTRDVCQGAFEFLLATGDFDSCRNILLNIFQEQNEDGDWPQWFMLYPRDKAIRAADSHGDIVYWPILSLTSYLERTQDIKFLKETTSGPQRQKPITILAAVNQAVTLINSRLVLGTKLPIYGNGDWNDSLQPVSEEFRTKVVSTWTAELQSLTYQALIKIYQLTGDRKNIELYQAELETINQNIKEHCMDDSVLSGLRYFGEGNSREFYLHPKDNKTGVRYSVLPMIYGILSEILDNKEVETHLSLIKEWLMGPDGVRLFDVPISYSDGETKEFKRAETASYFGREIGLMYTHAHLRYCEALAHLGKSEELLYYLNLVNPIGIKNKIPSANRRQSNCYYSSTDGLFLDRYEAGKDYKKLISGKIPLEGGWRVYSSGPGIYIKLVYECLLGIKVFSNAIELDPVLPKDLSGLTWNLTLMGKNICITYIVESENAIIDSVEFNEQSIPFVRLINRYRKAGLRFNFSDILPYLKETENLVTVISR